MKKLWAEKPEILRTYGMGKRRLQEWREKGFVKMAKLNEKKHVYRIKDVDNVLEQISIGRTPKRAV